MIMDAQSRDFGIENMTGSQDPGIWDPRIACPIRDNSDNELFEVKLDCSRTMLGKTS